MAKSNGKSKVGAALLAAGAWMIASPHGVAIATADGTDGVTSTTSSARADSARADSAPAAARRAARTAHADRRSNRRIARSAETRPQKSAASTTIGHSPRRSAATDAAETVPTPAATTPIAPMAAPAAPAPAAAVATAVSVPAVAPAAAAPQVAPADTLAGGATRSAHVAGDPASIRHWLADLPTSPLVNFLASTLFVARRGASGEPAPAAVTPPSLPVERTFVVSNLNDSGAGSLRQAILDANATAGDDRITFGVAGVIRVGRTALPTITDTVVIDGTTAPGFLTTPVVRIDYQNTDGVKLAAGSDRSEIRSLSLVDAAGAGVTIDASDTKLTGNYIGVWGNGRRVEGNRGDGILIEAGAENNQIGEGPRRGEGPYAVSNVISGNRGNGITISGADSNTVEANYIGTDSAGTRRLANRGNGIEITGGASDNTIGGVESNGNNPTKGTFARPLQGNLISGNRGDGVLIDSGATGNVLNGNYIGTTATGVAPLGNRGDGVAIVGADANSLVGTTALDDPFIFFNVLAGNRGNGLRISDSNDTIVWANFFGLGSDNATAVANRGDGLLVEGSSTRTTVGGEIPLGNVMTGNRRYGIEVTDTASGFISFNSFVGQTAFGATPVPNYAGGIRITSSNPAFDPGDSTTWNTLRTSLIGGNNGNGVEFLGKANGIEVTDTAVGTYYKINSPIRNLGNGIVIGGQASNIAIGGFQPSIQQIDSDFSVHIGGNRGYGVVFRGRAHDIEMYDTRVGLGIGVPIENAYTIPNGRGGVLIARGTSNIVLGGPRVNQDPLRRYSDEIAANRGNGVTARFTDGLQLLGTTVAGNAGAGVVLVGARNSVIGTPAKENIITDNGGDGLKASGRLTGSVAQSSIINDNGGTGVRLSGARGITVGGGGPGYVNEILRNGGWGILATGWSSGSKLFNNVVQNNTRGEVNTALAFGLQT